LQVFVTSTVIAQQIIYVLQKIRDEGVLLLFGWVMTLMVHLLKERPYGEPAGPGQFRLRYNVITKRGKQLLQKKSSVALLDTKFVSSSLKKALIVRKSNRRILLFDFYGIH